MSIHSELAADSGPSCKVCSYLATLAPPEKAEWQVELRCPVSEVGNTAVVNALARRGVPVSEVSVRRHRARHA